MKWDLALFWDWLANGARGAFLQRDDCCEVRQSGGRSIWCMWSIWYGEGAITCITRCAVRVDRDASKKPHVGAVAGSPQCPWELISFPTSPCLQWCTECSLVFAPCSLQKASILVLSTPMGPQLTFTCQQAKNVVSEQSKNDHSSMIKPSHLAGRWAGGWDARRGPPVFFLLLSMWVGRGLSRVVSVRGKVWESCLVQALLLPASEPLGNSKAKYSSDEGPGFPLLWLITICAEWRSFSRREAPGGPAHQELELSLLLKGSGFGCPKRTASLGLVLQEVPAVHDEGSTPSFRLKHGLPVARAEEGGGLDGKQPAKPLPDCMVTETRWSLYPPCQRGGREKDV